MGDGSRQSIRIGSDYWGWIMIRDSWPMAHGDHHDGDGVEGITDYADQSLASFAYRIQSFCLRVLSVEKNYTYVRCAT